MFRELVELGKKLEKEERLPPVGYYYYSEPIKWVVHIWPGDPPKIHLEKAELNLPRPNSGRRSEVQPHAFADEAVYALGVDKIKEADKKGKNEKRDKRAKEKHQFFLALLKESLSSPLTTDKDLTFGIETVHDCLEKELVQKEDSFEEILAKDWVSFCIEQDCNKRLHLFQHPESINFWSEVMRKLTAQTTKNDSVISGECSICGKEEVPLLKKLPLSVKISGTSSPLHSLNKSPFVSFVSGGSADKTAHIGLCFDCGDTAARVFNYLSGNPKHRKSLVSSDRRDSLENQTALFWMKGEGEEEGFQIGEASFSAEDIQSFITTILAEEKTSEENDAPSPDLSQLRGLLQMPWKPKKESLNLDNHSFYLAVLSPNVGRIALRDWTAISLSKLKENLQQYLEALSVVDVRGEETRPVSIRSMLKAMRILDPQKPNQEKTIDAGLTRSLIRSAYLGHHPPSSLLQIALQRFLIPKIRKNDWIAHALISSIKLILYFKTKEATVMERLDGTKKSAPYLCGRLLALLEEVQQIFHYRQYHKRLENTVVDRFYGAASSSPSSVFGNLLRQATTAHLPKVGREMNELIEQILCLLDDSGGFPKTLSWDRQAEFALGFYHQRASFRSLRKEKKEKKETENSENSESK